MGEGEGGREGGREKKGSQQRQKQSLMKTEIAYGNIIYATNNWSTTFKYFCNSSNVCHKISAIILGNF